MNNYSIFAIIFYMEEITKEWLKVFETLNESQRRWIAGVKSIEIGRGGISAVAEATNLSRTTVTKGVKEVKGPPKNLLYERTRKEGGGRKRIDTTDSSIKKGLEDILSETTAGDPMTLIRWTGKSVRKIAEQLSKNGHLISHHTVHNLLREMGYSLQSNRKSLSRESNPNRDRQFKIINRKVKKFIREGMPVVSVDTKKKELVGKFKNQGKTWKKKGVPHLVEDHDFPSRSTGKAVPYGTYDINRNEGFVNVGISSDTAEFAVNSISRWWSSFGVRNYSSAHKILICADGGGSNGSSNRLWKYSLQEFSDRTGLEVHVCHYPPGTSKWNKIEHRMFCYISSHWKGRPLESYEAIVNLIGSTTTKKGLKIKEKLDKRIYHRGKVVPDEEFSKINLIINKILPKWNYSISPF